MSKYKTKLIFTVLLFVNFSYAQQRELSSDAVSIANLIRDSSVINCIEQVEKEKKANFRVTGITMDRHDNFVLYNITGLLINGDIIAGNKTLHVEGSNIPEEGFRYKCTFM